jgi:uncharacterized protein (DUF1778 family)
MAGVSAIHAGMSDDERRHGHARDVARRIIADKNDIKLDAAQSRRFVEALLTPSPALSPRLRKAAREHRQRVAAR